MPYLGDYDANQYQDNYGEPLPAGDYLVTITESDIDTKEDRSQQVKVTMEVVSPEHYAGRKAWANFTLEHSNPKAVEVGRRILGNLCRAIGILQPRETEELHDIPFFTRLVVTTWDDGSLHNEAKAYWSTSSQAPPQPKPKRQAPAPQQQAPYGAPGGRPAQYQPPASQRPAAPPPQQWQPPQQQAPQQGDSNPLYPPNHPAQGIPPAGSPYPGHGGQPAQAWKPQGQPPQQYAPPQQQPYQPPSGAPPWAQHPQAPQPQPQPDHQGYVDENIPF